MKKLLLVISILFALAWIPSYSAAHREFLGRAVEKRVDVQLRSQPSSATIVFRGLMVFHPDRARRYFEAGVLKAPEHRLRIQVLEKSPSGVSSFSVPLGNLSEDVLAFQSAKSVTQGVTFYRNGSFDRKNGVGDEKDFRWAVDLEGREFYGHQLATKTHQLGPIFHVTSGEFYTKERTAPLMRRKGDDTFQYFGRAADEIATDLNLDGGDIVLTSQKTRTEILRVKQKPETTYEIVIENEPFPEHLMSGLDHFQYYYRLITATKSDWYEFKVADPSAMSSVARNERRYLNHANYVSPGLPGSDVRPCMPATISRRRESLR